MENADAETIGVHISFFNLDYVAEPCAELDGRANMYDSELCGNFTFWSSAPSCGVYGKEDYRCNGQYSGQCVYTPFIAAGTEDLWKPVENHSDIDIKIARQDFRRIVINLS